MTCLRRLVSDFVNDVRCHCKLYVCSGVDVALSVSGCVLVCMCMCLSKNRIYNICSNMGAIVFL